jgi:hypothetical protein
MENRRPNSARIVPNFAVKFFSYEQDHSVFCIFTDRRQHTGDENAQFTPIPILRLGIGACAGAATARTGGFGRECYGGVRPLSHEQRREDGQRRLPGAATARTGAAAERRAAAGGWTEAATWGSDDGKRREDGLRRRPGAEDGGLRMSSAYLGGGMPRLPGSGVEFPACNMRFPVVALESAF